MKNGTRINLANSFVDLQAMRSEAEDRIKMHSLSLSDLRNNSRLTQSEEAILEEKIDGLRLMAKALDQQIELQLSTVSDADFMKGLDAN